MDIHAGATPANDSSHYSKLPLRRGDLWIFGYGSLMWDPGFPYVQWAPALIYGYHRALCIASNRWRGTPARPGLVLGLDRGGACRGIAFLVARADVDPALEALWAREMRRSVYRPRLLRIRLPGRQVQALAFIADPKHAGYAGHLSINQTARRIAGCCGARGPNLEYLRRTVEHLSELGVRDHNLLRVLVAALALDRGSSRRIAQRADYAAAQPRPRRGGKFKK
jgi:cation transport protein ChaC